MTDPIATVRESQERMRLIANTLSAADINGLEGICGRAAAALDAVVAEIERLRLHHAAARAECERLAMQLAACGVVALANTTETAYRARAIHQDYRCDAVVAVAAAVDREMAHRAEIAALRADAQMLDWLQANPSIEVSSEMDEGDTIWRVHSVTGYPNDREWHVVGEGLTLRAAIDAARAKEAGDARS